VINFLLAAFAEPKVTAHALTVLNDFPLLLVFVVGWFRADFLVSYVFN